MALPGKLDEEYENLKKKITKLIPIIHRRRQVLVKNWIKKLDEPTTIETWQRLRNKYARNLENQLSHNSKLTFPFNKNAPEVLKNFQPGSNVYYSNRKSNQNIATRTNKRQSYHMENTKHNNEAESQKNEKKTKQNNRNTKSAYTETLGTKTKLNHRTNPRNNYLDEYTSKQHQSRHHEAEETSSDNKNNFGSIEDTNSNDNSEKNSNVKRWRTKAIQLEKLVIAQKVRINHLEQEVKCLKSEKSREIERLEKFHKVRIDDLSRIQTKNLKKLKDIQELHPAEKELISVPGNAAFEFDAVLLAAKSVPLNQHEEKTEIGSFFTTLSQTDLANNTNNNKDAPCRKHLKPTNKYERQKDYFNYLDRFQQTMNKIVSECKASNFNPSVTMNGLKTNNNRSDILEEITYTYNNNDLNSSELSNIQHNTSSSFMNLSEL
jgi:hypothetical protein